MLITMLPKNYVMIHALTTLPPIITCDGHVFEDLYDALAVANSGGRFESSLSYEFGQVLEFLQKYYTCLGITYDQVSDLIFL